MTVYLQSIDITPDGFIRVSGNLSSTNRTVELTGLVYVTPPKDGIWEFEIAETVTGGPGLQVLVPFTLRSEFADAGVARGVRIRLPDGRTETRLKVERVACFTESSENMTSVKSTVYDPSKGQLGLEVRYGGGCFDHDFRLEWDGAVQRIQPAIYTLQIVDLSPHDPCKALITETVWFDVTTPDVKFDPGSTLQIVTPSNSNPVSVSLGYSKTITLVQDSSVDVDGNLVVTLGKVEDSRCPTGAVCIWPGTVAVEVVATLEGQIHQVKVSDLDQGATALGVGGYSIRLVSVTPYPQLQWPSRCRPETSVTLSISRA